MFHPTVQLCQTFDLFVCMVTTMIAISDLVALRSLQQQVCIVIATVALEVAKTFSWTYLGGVATKLFVTARILSFCGHPPGGYKQVEALLDALISMSTVSTTMAVEDSAIPADQLSKTYTHYCFFPIETNVSFSQYMASVKGQQKLRGSLIEMYKSQSDESGHQAHNPRPDVLEQLESCLGHLGLLHEVSQVLGTEKYPVVHDDYPNRINDQSYSFLHNQTFCRRNHDGNTCASHVGRLRLRPTSILQDHKILFDMMITGWQTHDMSHERRHWQHVRLMVSKSTYVSMTRHH